MKGDCQAAESSRNAAEVEHHLRENGVWESARRRVNRNDAFREIIEGTLADAEGAGPHFRDHARRVLDGGGTMADAMKSWCAADARAEYLDGE